MAAASSTYAANPVTPQTERAREDQVENNAGGFVFEVSPKNQFRRFIILGTTGNTYYQKEADLTKMNLDSMIKFIESDGGVQALDMIFEISDQGLALRQKPTLFALAMVLKHGDLDTRRRAADLFPKIARTGTMALNTVAYMDKLSGWSTVRRRAVSNWFTSKTPQSLAYQAAKYFSREDWTLLDMLRLAHPSTDNEQLKMVFDAIAGRTSAMDLGGIIGENALTGKEMASKATTSEQIANLVEAYNLPWEAVDDKWKNDPAVWDKMLNSTGYEALIRNLNRLTYSGFLKPMGANVNRVVEMIDNEDEIRKSRVHPFKIYLASKTYASGRGFRGTQTWQPIPQIVAALDRAYIKAFKYLEPTGKRIFHAMDVSGSMTVGVPGMVGVSCIEAEMALVLPMIHAEPNYFVGAFSHKDRGRSAAGYYARGTRKSDAEYKNSMDAIVFTPNSSLKEAYDTAHGYSQYMDGTDCSLPMQYAQANEMEVDCFVVYTDSETWAGGIQPYQALLNYRKSSGITDAKLIVVGMVGNKFTIADPRDPGMLDVVGLDASLPQLVSNFAAGLV
jgi:60 kDa SS-A/Ro ribonucleoprotein